MRRIGSKRFDLLLSHARVNKKFYLPHAAKTKAVEGKKRPEDDVSRLVGTLSLPHVVCRHMLGHSPPPLANYAAGKLALFGFNLHVDAAEL